METIRTNSRIIIVVLALLGLVAALPFAIAGSLEPSNPPGPTMKTLDEVEPRIPIPSASGRDPASTFIISWSGSYYLTGDRSCSGTGIEVIADNVTIDLMGYSLIGTGSGTNYGIHMDGRSNVEVRNGTVRNFCYGIFDVGVSGKNHRVIDVRSVFNGQDGIVLLCNGLLVKGCTASDNGDSATNEVYGIFAGVGSTVTGNTAYNNGTSATYVYGIRVGCGSTVTGNTVYDNGDSASFVSGIFASSGSTVTGNTAYHNGTSAAGTVYGIYLGGDNLVDQNTAYNNNTASGGTNMNNPGNCTFGTNHAP